MIPYRLIVITHGGDDTTPMLRDTLAAFEEMVTPEPTERVLIEDGIRKERFEWKGLRFTLEDSRGFCETARLAWGVAAAPGVKYVYWLEHDFLHLRPVNLGDLALVLETQHIAQVSLMRQPVNEAEGSGIADVRREEFVSHLLTMPKKQRRIWMEQAIYWTTNASLFRSELARNQAWPKGPECEGKFGMQLRDQGYSFGVWGDGEPWILHVGERSGHGY